MVLLLIALSGCQKSDTIIRYSDDLKIESEQKRKLHSILMRQSENTLSKKFPKNSGCSLFQFKTCSLIVFAQRSWSNALPLRKFVPSMAILPHTVIVVSPMGKNISHGSRAIWIFRSLSMYVCIVSVLRVTPLVPCAAMAGNS